MRHLTLLAPAQDFIQILQGVEQSVEIFVASRELGKATVVVGDEAGQKRVCRLDRADAGESQLLHQTILQRMMSALDASLRLAGIGAQNLLQLPEGVNCGGQNDAPNAPAAGPDPAVHGVVRWRRVDLRDELQRRFGVALHERPVGKVLAKLGYRKLSARPRHHAQAEGAVEDFKKTSQRAWMKSRAKRQSTSAR